MLLVLVLVDHLACLLCFFSDFCKTVIGLAYKSSFNSLLQHFQESPTWQGVRQYYGNPLVQAHELSVAKEVERNRSCRSGWGGSSHLHSSDLPWLLMVQSRKQETLCHKWSFSCWVDLRWWLKSHIVCRQKLNTRGGCRKKQMVQILSWTEKRKVLLVGHYAAALKINSICKLIYHISLWN